MDPQSRATSTDVDSELNEDGEEQQLPLMQQWQKMTGQEKEVIVDAEELAAQEAALTKAEEEERIAASETDKWEVPDEEDEEEPLPEIEPLPKEAAEGSRYPKLTKAKTGRLKDAPLTGHIVPHTHWDRAWYLPFQKYRYRLWSWSMTCSI